MILNLIKAASFHDLPLRSRATYVEAIYSQNVAFAKDRFDTADLLAAVEKADAERIKRNFSVLTSTTPAVVEEDGMVLSSRTTSMLDLFPGLEAWMFDELFALAGVGLLHRIASIFATNPYEYRRGWPDLTIWRGNEIRFVEIKAPGDKVQASQRRLITELGQPAGLDFWIAEVIPT
ncbi:MULTISPECIES: VRR-NUC domain-containing protein [unclassified Cupriavidus]|uniref:VRR-NUC domain-containing protein n=1 Tax=unclassified Cupriavidus TaxID=2640874 RepID=UPI00313CCD77